LALAVSAQTAKPTPPPESEVVKISTNLIQLDVSVTDQKGNVVRDMKANEFQVFENGERQKISNFSFKPGVPESAPPKQEKNVAGSVPEPPKTVRPEQVRRTIALVVDDLGVSFESAHFIRDALKKYVNEQIQDGDLVAIVRTGAGTGALQQFTSDKRVLLAAIERVKWNPQGRVGITPFAPATPTALELTTQGEDGSEEDLQAERNFNNSFEDFRNSTFVAGTLGALRFVISGMSKLPGRKSIVMFSEGFRLLERDSTGQEETGMVLEMLHRLTDFANRASVVIYTIDPRGLQTFGVTAADEVVQPTAENLNRISAERNDELFETQAGLSYLAEETGGYTVKNTNDISSGLKRILSDQSYYLIGYEPDSDTFDAAKRKFNKLEIRTTRPGVHVRYRSGFFNVSNEKLAAAPPGPTTLNEQISAALMSPFAINDIAVSLNALFGNSVQKGNYVRSILHIDGAGLKFVDTTDGKRKAEITVVGASFDEAGNVVDQVTRSYGMTANNEAGIEELKRRGIIYYFEFQVKKPGAFQYRVAVRDNNAAKVGSASQFVEVPNLKKKFLTLSSVVLQNLTRDEWEKAGRGESFSSGSDPMSDTSKRKFKSGTILKYGYEIYNARLSNGKPPDLTSRVRVFRDGKLVFEGKPAAVALTDQKDLERMRASSALSLGGEIEPGEYVLQVIVIDVVGNTKQKPATQFVQFEVVN